ncbi:MAG: hypothetical protein Q8O28_14450 [Smithellaceae bacterium]|nr:hypothetical protein [Smithellaceae bacterium]
MKKIILSAFILISFFVFPLFSQASYIIHLKGGGQFITTKYWEEGGQITFFVSGGTMGIEKDTVSKIEKSTAKTEDVYETKKPALPPVAAEKKLAATGNTPAKEDDSKKDPAIMKEFEQLQKSFAERQNMTVDELNDLKKNLTALRDKIFSKRLEHDYLEESSKVAEMRFFVSDHLITKSKNQ